MISFIVPAHNEERLLPATIESIRVSARQCGVEHEVIVVDDASTDATAEVARTHGARVVSVAHRQIAATRNSGARAGEGERLFFVDADTLVNDRTLRAALSALDRGAVGGGAVARFAGPVPIYARLLLLGMALFQKVGGVSSGSFMFCTRRVFEATGGFDERLFAAEDAAMSQAIKRQGRFVLLFCRVATSGRRVRRLDGLRLLGTLLRLACHPAALTRREGVERVWYDSDRSEDEESLTSWVARLSNVAALLLMLVILIGPVIGWLPQPRSVSEGAWENLVFASRAIRVHVGLVLLPLGLALARGLFHRQTLGNRLFSLTLATICLWVGWRALRGCWWVWRTIIASIAG